MRTWPLLLVPLLALAAAAQNNPAKSGTGAVTGHVYCADTNAPARMAHIQLEPVKDADQRAASHSPTSGMPPGGVVQSTLDGSFVIPKVPPGSYYVVVTAPGYLSPRADAEDFDDAAPPPPAGQPPLVVPRVDVEADQTAAVDIRMERGAAVSGAIRFDDGSPAAGVLVMLLHKSKNKWVQSNSQPFTTPGSQGTDDMGHYRISGLRDREYVLQALLVFIDLLPEGAHAVEMSGKMNGALVVYSGDATRQADAVPFKLTAGEERTGEDITIPLSKLHSISGVVTAARDGHAINGGNLGIRMPEDSEPMVDAEIGNDGAFHLEGVPEGAYILRVHNARDKQMQTGTTPGNVTYSSEKTIHQYGDLEQTIKVEGDIPNLILAVPEQKNQAAASQ